MVCSGNQGIADAANANGVNTQENQGIATTFTNGLNKGNEPNQVPNSTNDQMLIATCALKANRHGATARPCSPTRRADTQINAATKPNDSHNPAPNTALGANNNTAAKDNHHAYQAELERLPNHTHANTNNINTERCVGTENPASSA